MRLQPFGRASLGAACVLLCLSGQVQAQPASGTAPAPAAELAVTPNFTGDDPVAVRDALARKLTPGKTRTFAHRVEDLIGTALPKTLHDPVLTDANLARDLAFVVPAPYGIRYRAKVHVMTVDVDLSDSDHPDAIVLKKTIMGPGGRKLVIAAEAKAKGYIQNVDVIELDITAAKRNKTTVRGRFVLPEAEFEAAGDGDLALVLICRVVPPYLTETVEHSDPTNEEPTDITTRTATLHAHVGDVWLINREKGVVLAKGLHVVK
ncbi:hypothetical protein AWB64_03384 [Caballeronia sordidicola]|uniref:Secreted protein n=1 Tax=Caballeronia sordidicola TaxID=196367 RepID=A0A158GS06_CABSO|nr:hypothetical protein [Caballeronia sordidicola]SAL34657.1 hypothetical protein AWB64_03384 [Caballeronia sordidicola]